MVELQEIVTKINSLLIETRNELLWRIENCLYNAELLKDIDDRLLIAEKIIYICFSARRSICDDYENIMTMIEKIIMEKIEND